MIVARRYYDWRCGVSAGFGHARLIADAPGQLVICRRQDVGIERGRALRLQVRLDRRESEEDVRFGPLKARIRSEGRERVVNAGFPVL